MKTSSTQKEEMKANNEAKIYPARVIDKDISYKNAKK